MSIGFWQIAIVVILVVLLFGRGKISSLMGDVAKGIKSFKAGIREGEMPPGDTAKNNSVSEDSKAINNETSASTSEASEKKDDSNKG